MHDQADELRRLVLRTAAQNRAPEAPAPPVAVVSGGKGGVGSTTVAVNLSIALARQGRRAVLVDADFSQPDATTLCHLAESDTVSDVLTGRRTVHEVLQRGPAGIQVLPGNWAPETFTECTPIALERLLAELRRLGPHADVIVLDVGSGLGQVTGRFWQVADFVLLVTTNESASIMDAYAAIKVLAGSEARADIHTVVNQVNDAQVAADVHARIQLACKRFLRTKIGETPYIPFDAAITEATRDQRPFLLQASGCEAARRVELLAERVADLINQLAVSRKTVA